MEPLSDTLWDVVICGTGLQQSLLALSISRSGKKVLHLDPNGYYGGCEAAFSLQEVDTWVAALSAASATGPRLFNNAEIIQTVEDPKKLPSRAYSLALAPQIVHARSELVNQLVSSRVHQQIEFVSVGSFFIFKPSTSTTSSSSSDVPSTSTDSPATKPPPTLTRIPSTREDVFSTTAIPAKTKRALMKFLKLVTEFDDASAPSRETWLPHTERPLADLLTSEFKLDDEARAYILTLTLSLDGKIATRDGLAAIHRHLSSMGTFGPGFAAVYPKYGGLSEVAQAACRAGAVGGGVYMLGTGIKGTKEAGEVVEVELADEVVKTKLLVRADETPAKDGRKISRLVAVVDSPLKSMFEASVEGAPTAAVAVVAFPPGSIQSEAGIATEYPVYVSVHSGDTGECPAGQSVLYLTTLSTPHSKDHLQTAAKVLVSATSPESPPPILYKLYYEQAECCEPNSSSDWAFEFAGPVFDLAFNDTRLDRVREAWKRVMGEEADEAEAEYMKFPEREGAEDDDNDMYD